MTIKSFFFFFFFLLKKKKIHSGSNTHDLVLHSREVPLELEFMVNVEHSYEEAIDIIKDPTYCLKSNRRLVRECLNFLSDNFVDL
jgi:hypothetical protein